MGAFEGSFSCAQVKCTGEWTKCIFSIGEKQDLLEKLQTQTMSIYPYSDFLDIAKGTMEISAEENARDFSKSSSA